jgi:hypothetical protein
MPLSFRLVDRHVCLAAATVLALLPAAFGADSSTSSDPLGWPQPSRQSRPWSYWHWMGSAVDAANITRELEDFRKAGWGGLHIVPTYGAKGYESRFIDYLSPKWMEMLRHTVTEAARLDLGIDMTTGSGWCFGGPTITAELASAVAQVKTYDVAAGAKLAERLAGTPLAVVALPQSGPALELTSKLTSDGGLDWTAPQSSAGNWRVYALSLRPTIKVKRPAPGAGGWMLNPFYGRAMDAFLEPFSAVFAAYTGPKPRAMYHDSYEYNADWSPDLLVEFERRRGYRLQDEFRELFDGGTGDRTARVKADYRATLAELLLERVTGPWVAWSHQRGFITRNEAHGSPGNLLDLYAAADVPETEMFNTDRSSLVSRFSSSAAHVAGRKLVASETGTWIAEHFTEKLGSLKDLIDQLWVSGVNHVFYHGSAYSPSDAPWPGWLFYASTQMNSRNPIWHDVPTLNGYIARAQSMLQDGRPANDVLLYWPIRDVWHDARGTVIPMTVHNRGWVEGRVFGRLAQRLIDRGYRLDFISDRQLMNATARGHDIVVPGGRYRALVVPRTEHMPVETMERIAALARSGVAVVLEEMPADVDGLARLDERRARLAALAAQVKKSPRVFAGDAESGLQAAGIPRESLADIAGLEFIRRASADGGLFYFVANRGKTPVDAWVPLASAARGAVLLDPMTGETGTGAIRAGKSTETQVYLQLQPGQSIFVRCLGKRLGGGARWPYRRAVAERATPVAGPWSVRFTEGGPERPAPYETAQPGSWTRSSAEAERFSGTAVYAIRFAAPAAPAVASGGWFIDLGTVAESARVRLNGRDLGTLILPPFRIYAGTLDGGASNTLEVEVTNLAANRVRDLDRRGVVWRNFHNINFVNIDYKPFDASHWPVRDSGLLGPVTLVPASDFKPDSGQAATRR